MRVVFAICASALLWCVATGSALAWSVSASAPATVPNAANLPFWGLYPDGHLAVLRTGDPDAPWMMFWSEFRTYRSVGTGPTPGSQQPTPAPRPVFGGDITLNRWDNGGSWLFSAHRLRNNDIAGFYHAEDHWYPHVVGPSGNGVAWKSMAVTYSSDNGLTWRQGEQIITSDQPKPAQPTWGGTGGGIVVRDEANKRWVCFFTTHYLLMAISEDPLGRAGTWKKLYNGSFSEPGLGGKATPVANLDSQPGGNPAVVWNTALKRWVIVWHAWNGNLYVSTSPNLTAWDPPRLLLAPTTGRRLAYPTVIGVDDKIAGKVANLYFADMSSTWSDRRFKRAKLTFAN